MSVNYKSVFRLAISRTVLEKVAKKSENREIWANFDPPPNFFGGDPTTLTPVLGTSFQGLLPGKVWTTPLTLKGWEKISPPNFFWGEEPPRGTQVRHHDPLPLVKIWSECDPWPLNKASFNIELFELWPPSNFFGGSPQNFETSFGYSFSRPIPRISLDHVLRLWFTTLGGLGPPNFNGGSPPKFLDPIFKITPISDYLS